MRNTLPNQKVSDKEKEKEDWYEPTCDYMIAKAIYLNDKEEVKKNIDAANGIVDSETYEYVMNPLASTDATLKNLPGEIRNVDFITSIKEKNIGEYINLPYSAHVSVNNVDVVMKRTEAIKKEIGAKMQEAFMQLVEGTQQEEGAPQPDIAKFAKDFEESWVDIRATEGQNRLNFLNDLTDFDTKRTQGFYYWWATEEFYTHTYLENGSVRTVVINPMEGYPIDNGEQFVDEMDGFMYRKKTTFIQFYEHYKQYVADKDIPAIEALYDRYTKDEPLSVPVQMFSRTYENTTVANENRKDVTFVDDDSSLYVYELEWKTFKHIKYLTYEDAFGVEQEIVVPHDYKLDKAKGDLHIKSDWINANMTMFRFGEEGSAVYTKPFYTLVQRRDEKNPNITKLSYGGKRGLLNGIRINPIPKRLLPYTALVRIYTLQLERTIAKYKGNIMLVPQSMINSDASGTTKEKFYYMKADGTLVYDDSQVNTNDANAFRVVGNDGLEKYMGTLDTIIRGLIKDAWDLANMNDERYGATPTGSTVTNANRNAATARLGSALMITMFNKALEKDHMMNLEFSKIAWINGASGSYWNKAKNNFEYISVDGEEHAETDYGIFVKNSIDEEAKLKEYKDLAFSAAQNGDFELASEAIGADCVSELREYTKQHAEALREFEEAKSKRESEAIKYAADKLAQDKVEDRASAERIAQWNNETKLAIADKGIIEPVEDDTTLDDSRKDRELALKERVANDNKVDSNIKNNIKERELTIKDRQSKEKV